MDIPDLVRERLGDEEITAGVSIGDEDAVCLTPTRTLIYRSEGLLSDQQVEEYTHDAERLAVKEGRRKTKFLLEYVEGTESFTVPANRGEKVLELLLEGILRLDGVIEERESIAGVYRFTELTLIVTEGRLLKHIGNNVWDDDFEAYPFEEVTGLEFERASNATSIAISIGGRPQRVKVPNDTARVVQQTIEEVLFDYYDVASLDELNSVVGSDDGGPETDSERSDDIGFEDGIDPLVTDTEDDADEAKLEDQLEDAGSTSGEERGARPETMDVSIGNRASTESDSASEGADSTGSAAASAGESSSGSASRSASDGVPETTAGTAESDAAESESPSTDTGSESPSTDAEEWSSSNAEQSSAERSSEVGAGTSVDEADTSSGDPASDADTSAASEPESSSGSASTTADSRSERVDGDAAGSPTEHSDERAASTQSSASATRSVPAGAASQEDVEALTARLDQLTDAVERQNELLKRQHKAIKQLAREVRSE